MEMMTCKEREVLMSGAAGTGKSRACLERVHAMMLKYPGARGLIARKTAVSLTSTAIATYKEFVAKEALESGEVRFYGGSASEPSSFRYGNGSMLVVTGLDKATRIMSSEYDVAYIQEATELTEDDWEMVTTRLRHGVIPYQQIIADCNPDAPHHWLKNRCDNGRTKIIYCRHEDNPRLFKDGEWTPEGLAYLQTLDNLSGVRYERLRLGKWAAADGLVYAEYDTRIHLRPGIATVPPKTWPRYWGIDFGFTNPTVVQFWAKDNDDRLWLYREFYATGKLPEEVAEGITKMRKHGGKTDPDPVAIITDHDAAGRTVLERKLGVSTVNAHKSVVEGIEAVQARLKLRQDGTPGLYICRDAVENPDPALVAARKPTCTQEEILEYAWEVPVARRALKEEPRKLNDHGMDAMRYVVAYLDIKGRPSFRSFSY